MNVSLLWCNKRVLNHFNEFNEATNLTMSILSIHASDVTNKLFSLKSHLNACYFVS